MKKILMMAVVAMISVSAYAQAWVGGSVSFSSNKSEYDGKENYNKKNVTLAPIFGYDLNEKFAVGVELGYNHAEEDIDINNNWYVAPFVRYNFAKCGDVNIFADGLVGFTSVHTNGYDENYNILNVSVRPGVSYEFNEKCALEAHIGNLGWSHGTQDKIKNNSFNLRLSTELSLGFVYKL